MTLENHLVLFAREPRLGRGKRRLARDVGDVTAWRFHWLTTGRLLQRLAGDPRWTTYLAVTPDRATMRGRGLWRTPARLVPQGTGDLGARMGRMMHVMPPGPVVIVGADIPDVRPRHVAQAFRLLGRHDAVLGPADDGGYWLVGLRRRPSVRPPFAGVRWGGPQARADTLANLERLGMSVGFLETLSDVDTGADLRPHHWR
jgi:rSAM/selenodomain-associated transferase 1